MSKGLSPKLPLTKDPIDGYSLTKTFPEMIIQNLKMLILTAPGERIMEPEFGVGLRNFLFENPDANIESKIRSKIKQQVQKYMPFIEVQSVDFNLQEGQNIMFTSVRFRIIPLDVTAHAVINTGLN